MNQFIAFIRHGQYQQLADTPSAMQPFPLTEKGRQQAGEGSLPVIGFLQSHGLELYPTLYSSSLLRAWETASEMQPLLIAHCGQTLEISSHDELVERRVGSVANLSIAEIEQLLDIDPRYETPPPGWKSNSHYCLPFPGAESLLQSGQRVADFVNHCADVLGDGQLMLFYGHGAAFRHAAYLMGCLEFNKIDIYSMYHAKPVFIQRMADSTDKQPGQWQVVDEKLWKPRLKEKFTD